MVVVGTKRLWATAWAVASVGKETSAPPQTRDAADAPSAAVAAAVAGHPHPADNVEEGRGWRVVVGADHH